MKQLLTVDMLKRTTPIGVREIVACQINRLNEAKSSLEADGLVVRDAKGSVIEHPALKIVNHLEKELKATFSTFGER